MSLLCFQHYRQLTDGIAGGLFNRRVPVGLYFDRKVVGDRIILDGVVHAGKHRHLRRHGGIAVKHDGFFICASTTPTVNLPVSS